MNTRKPLPNTMHYTISNFSKVLEITLLFWIIKILTTGMGEAASDYLSYRLLGPTIAAIIFGGCLIASLVLVAIIVALVFYIGTNHLDIKNVNNERGGGSICTTKV